MRWGSTPSFPEASGGAPLPSGAMRWANRPSVPVAASAFASGPASGRLPIHFAHLSRPQSHRHALPFGGYVIRDPLLGIAAGQPIGIGEQQPGHEPVIPSPFLGKRREHIGRQPSRDSL